MDATGRDHFVYMHSQWKTTLQNPFAIVETMACTVCLLYSHDVTSSLIGWMHTQNYPCTGIVIFPVLQPQCSLLVVHPKKYVHSSYFLVLCFFFCFFFYGYISVNFTHILEGYVPGTVLQSHNFHTTWWHHQMETFSALLALCAGNSPVSGEFPAQRPVMRSFDVFFDLRLIKRLSKQSWGWWFEMLSCPLWHHSNDCPPLVRWHLKNSPMTLWRTELYTDCYCEINAFKIAGTTESMITLSKIRWSKFELGPILFSIHS